MINSAGERIGPFEVESKLIEHQAVLEAWSDRQTRSRTWRNRQSLYYFERWLYRSAELLEDIRLFVRRQLLAHAAPREVEVVEELPKTKISGKILRRELKQREQLKQSV